jgi:hypothetical protein
MAVFEDYCTDDGANYTVYCTLTGEPVTKENADTLYEFMALVRRLPKVFKFILDARLANLQNFLPFVPQILVEARKPGLSKCFETEIIVPPYPFVVKFFAPILELVKDLTNVHLTLL